MNIPYRVYEPENRFHEKMKIFARIDLPYGMMITIRFYSSSRNGTDYAIYDENEDFMGRRMFTCSFGPILTPLTLALIEDVNVLLDEYGAKIAYEDFIEITKKAINFCEGKYGNHSMEDSDCVIIIS